MVNRTTVTTMGLACVAVCVAAVGVPRLSAGYPCVVGCWARTAMAHHTGTQAGTIGVQFSQAVTQTNPLDESEKNLDPPGGTAKTITNDAQARYLQFAFFDCSNCTYTVSGGVTGAPGQWFALGSAYTECVDE